MSKDSDSDVEAESGSDTDSDWLSEEGPLKLRNQERKRKVTRQSSRRSGNEDRRVSFSPHVLPQKKPTSILQKLGENLIQEPKLSVTCGNKEGILHKDKFSKGEPCILTAGRWLTPPHFEKFGGKERNKNWKYSEGFLSSPSSFKMKRSRDKEPQSRKEMNRSRRSTRHGKNCHTINSVSTSASCESDRSTDDKEEEDDGGGGGDSVRFKVTCSTGKGVLHVERFATETHGKCIRTQDAWLTPKDFLNRNKPDGNWRRDIRNDDGEPLGELLMKRVLKRHMVNCLCCICTEDPPHVEGFLSSPSSFKMKRSRDKEPQSRKEMNRSRRSTRHGKNCHTINSVSTSASCESDRSTDDKEEEDGGGGGGDSVRFKVTCSTGKGVLHVERFATETHGKCIRTQDAWLTPKDFLNRNKPDGNWRRDIRNDDGEPLGELLMKRVLKRHMVNCLCYICTEDPPHVEGFLSSPSSFKMKRSRDKEPQSRKEMNRSRRSTRHGKNCHTINSVSTSASCESDRSTDDKEEEDDGGGGGDSVRFKVTCSTGKGVLHVERFATETHGKCIRTQDAWLTPKDFLNRNKPDGNWRRDIRNDDGEPLGELLMKRVLKRHMVNCLCYICTEDPPHVLDQNNDDWCFKCKGEGDLVCCRTCPRAFHHHCHKPALRDDDIDSDKWTCSFCKKSRRKKPS